MLHILLDRSRQRLLDTGLYKTVTMQTELTADGELLLHIVLEEKRSWLLLPRLSRNVDGDIKLGIRLRMYNLNGADQTLQFLTQRENKDNGDTIDEFRFSYDIPLYTRDLQLRWGLSHAEKATEVDDFDNVETTDELQFRLAREWPIEYRNASLFLSGTIAFEQLRQRFDYPAELEAPEAGNFNRLRIGLAYDATHLERYRRYGSFYEVSMSQGFDWLGSDYESTVLNIEAINYIPLNDFDNFNFRLVFERANTPPYGAPLYGIGGGSSLRGLEDFDERGDALAFANIEYLVAWRRAPQFRHSLFIDVGNIYDDWEDMDLEHARHTIGTGFRWKIDSFVNTDLFIDYGYDPDAGEGKLYGGTSLVF